MRGLQRDEHVEEFMLWFKKLGLWAACLQETWRLGNTLEQHNDVVIINTGPEHKLCRRGSLGVAVVLSKNAQKAWEDAGSQVLRYGLRVIAVRLTTQDKRGRPIHIFLVSAYAPVGSAKRQDREAYYADLQQCINECKRHEVLIIGTDANASCGIRGKHDNKYEPGRDQVRGPFGALYQNKAGKELCAFLAIHQLCLPTTYFQKHAYETWKNPGNNLWHQLDHFIMARKDLKRVADAGRVGLPGKPSDHHAVAVKLTICRTKQPRPRGEKKPRIDRTLLQDEETRDAFVEAVKTNMVEHEKVVDPIKELQRLIQSLQQAATTTLANAQRKQPDWFTAAASVLQPAICARNAAQKAHDKAPSTQTRRTLRNCRKRVKREVRRAERAWLRNEIDHIDGLARGTVLISPKNAWAAIDRLRKGKSVTKRLAPMVFTKEDGTKCKSPEESFERMRGYQAKIWDKMGTYDPLAMETIKQRDPKPFLWMADSPSDEEITAAVAKLSNGKSGADAECPAEYYKALETDEVARGYIRKLVYKMWHSGSYFTAAAPPAPAPPPEPPPIPPEPPPALSPIAKRRSSRSRGLSHEALRSIASINTPRRQRKKKPQKPKVIPEEPEPFTRPPKDTDADRNGVLYPEWAVARLKLLPKKGDLSLCKNWRGICLLDIASKIFSNILVARLQKAQETLGLEAQCGFRGKRGTIDGLWNLAMALQKRKEHGLETWALFIDLVKAFDTVSREALFTVLRKFGMPDHFINLLVRLHTGVTIKLKLGDNDVEIPSKIGVRQGSCEGPVLFLFIMQAALETMEWPVAKPTFCTKEFGPITGANTQRKRNVTNFDMWSSLFADDCGLLFETREDMVKGANYIYNHLKRFGLLMHVGRGKTKSKTEAVYFPAQRQPHSDGDQRDFAVDGDGFISFSTEFIYLGSLIHHTLTSGTDVSRRISKASSAFGALQNCFFKSRLPTEEDKGLVFVSLCLSILLYGSECWNLRQKEFQRLKVFYNQCVRSMCKVSMRQVFRHRISTKKLLQRLGIRSFEYYYRTRLLRWVGHVARMPMTRTPRMMLTSWVRHKRPVGAPQMTIGRTVKKALAAKGISVDFKEWHTLAQDRAAWRAMIDPLRF
jgi:hypothetical protein